MKQCTFCRESMQDTAIACPYCTRLQPKPPPTVEQRRRTNQNALIIVGSIAASITIFITIGAVSDAMIGRANSDEHVACMALHHDDNWTMDRCHHFIAKIQGDGFAGFVRKARAWKAACEARNITDDPQLTVCVLAASDAESHRPMSAARSAYIDAVIQDCEARFQPGEGVAHCIEERDARDEAAGAMPQ